MIYSASRRTDLPRFYPDVLVEKVRRSRKLDAIVFWTKDPRNLVDHPGLANVLSAYPSIIQLTITGLGGSAWEPNVPTYETLAPAIRTLGQQLPDGAIQWRFDPILADETLFARFESVLAMLTASLGHVRECTISFPDAYKKVLSRLKRSGLHLPTLSHDREQTLTQDLLKRARSLSGCSDFTFHACCEPHLLSIPGVTQAHCVDGALFDTLYDTSLASLPIDRGQRSSCGCTRSTDIGSYDQPCHHDCLYCYAR